MLFSYGITDKDLLFCNNKLEKQDDYLTSNTVITNSGQYKTFKDFSFSANLSSRYYAEVANRVNTINSMRFEYDLMPVFLTITLNSGWRNALKGDFTRLLAFDLKYVPSTVKYKMNINAALNIKDLIGVLNYQWHSYLSRSIFRKNKRMYIRVFEPHKKDGVPHIHALLFIPEIVISQAKNLFMEIFNAPMNITQNPNILTTQQMKNGEINGFQWTFKKNGVSYIMKYIQKTFINYKETQSLDYMSAWYVKHRVSRFLTSRETIPLWVYRKIFFLEKDFFVLSMLLKDSDTVFEWDFEEKYIYITNTKRQIEIIYQNGYYQYKLCGRVLKEKKNDLKSYRFSPKPVLKQNKREKHHNFTFNGVQYFRSSSNKIMKCAVAGFNFIKASDYSLLQHFMSLDIETCNLFHYGLVQNEIIKRGLLDAELQNINDFNLDIGFQNE